MVLYTGHQDADVLFQALDAGACGFVLKESRLSELLRALRIMARGARA